MRSPQAQSLNNISFLHNVRSGHAARALDLLATVKEALNFETYAPDQTLSSPEARSCSGQRDAFLGRVQCPNRSSNVV